MTTDQIRAAVLADPALAALIPDTQSIAEALSVGRTRPNGREVGNGLILATIGLAAGNALLDVLNTAPEFRHVRPLLEQGRLDVSSPLVCDALSGMVGTVLTQEQADALIALGREPDPVHELDIRRALWSDDGQELF